PVEELYDLQADPHEINNLAADPAYLETKERLADALDAWQARIDDRGRIREDPAIAAKWDAAMKRTYDAKDANRPENWFEVHPSLGSHVKQP
ncbi:MAG: hypothetical protein ACR2NZ_12850, partial [Rubripirellula sp.]